MSFSTLIANNKHASWAFNRGNSKARNRPSLLWLPFFFFKLHALDARQMRPRERTAVRLSISFPRPVVHPPKGPPKDTGIRIEGSPMCERKEDGKKYEDTSTDKDYTRKWGVGGEWRERDRWVQPHRWRIIGMGEQRKSTNHESATRPATEIIMKLIGNPLEPPRRRRAVIGEGGGWFDGNCGEFDDVGVSGTSGPPGYR